MIKWPVIIKHSDDAELIYICDHDEWLGDAELHDMDYEESDFLIDSSGHLFNLTTRANKLVNPQPLGESMTLDAVLGLVKAHAAQKGSCCVAKLYAPTISDAFKIVESLNET